MSPSADASKLPRNGGVPPSIVVGVALAALAGGGGVGSGITAATVSAELRETRAALIGRLDRIEERVQTLGAVEARLRELELWRARAEGR